MGMGEKGTADAQQMSEMMHGMSGEMMDAGQHKQMDQMRKQTDQMPKDMPAHPG